MDAWTEISWLLAVMAGGSAGSAARHIVNRLANEFAEPLLVRFPWHTFGINVLGSFVLGLVIVWYKNHPQPGWLLLLGTGFCGGFTTFSTFSLEIIALIERDRPVAAVGYVLGSVLLGLAAAWAAVKLARG